MPVLTFINLLTLQTSFHLTANVLYALLPLKMPDIVLTNRVKLLLFNFKEQLQLIVILLFKLYLYKSSPFKSSNTLVNNSMA